MHQLGRCTHDARLQSYAFQQARRSFSRIAEDQIFLFHGDLLVRKHDDLLGRGSSDAWQEEDALTFARGVLGYSSWCNHESEQFLVIQSSLDNEK